MADIIIMTIDIDYEYYGIDHIRPYVTLSLYASILSDTKQVKPRISAHRLSTSVYTYIS